MWRKRAFSMAFSAVSTGASAGTVKTSRVMTSSTAMPRMPLRRSAAMRSRSPSTTMPIRRPSRSITGMEPMPVAAITRATSATGVSGLVQGVRVSWMFRKEAMTMGGGPPKGWCLPASTARGCDASGGGLQPHSRLTPGGVAGA